MYTGASSGIGEACAWRFAEAGCKLVLIARRENRLTALKQALQQEYSVAVHTVVMDVTDIPAVMELPNQLPSEFATVDILVNNAGLALGIDAGDEVSALKDAQDMLQCNVMAVIAMTKAFVSRMRERNFGHVIMMSSIAGKEHYAGGSVYCATKHALEGYTGGLRHDLVGTNIRVTGISPGAVKTEFSIVRFNGDVEKADAVYDRIHPLTAADIADNVLYAVTRPTHVQIADITCFATYQCSAKGLARVLPE